MIEKLLGYIHRAFDKEPHTFVAVRIRHRSGSFRWVVADRVLTGYLSDVQIFSIDLRQYTLRTLLDVIWGIDGMEVAYAADADSLKLSACTLISGSGSQSVSNGDNLLAYTSLLWVYLDAMSVVLSEAKVNVVAMIEQMSLKTAGDDWLDEWGGYFGIRRLVGEQDSTYANRIVVEVMRPRGNNTAIEMALMERFGQDADVVDLVLWDNSGAVYGGGATHNGVEHYNAIAKPLYGLFRVVIGYDLLSGGDMNSYAKDVRAFIEKLRDAGTHLESLRLSSSAIGDDFSAPSDSASDISVSMPLNDALDAPAEVIDTIPVSMSSFPETFAGSAESTVDLLLSYSTTYSGLRSFNGNVIYASGAAAVGDST